MPTDDQRLPTTDFAGYFKKFIFFSFLLALVVSRWSGVASAEDWLEGASGYVSGVEQAKVSGKPMIVMFYTDWCGYCRKLQKNVLDKPEVQKALSSFVKVRINPEKGTGENQLGDQYGIEGFPSVYFENPKSGGKPHEAGGAIRNPNAFISAVKKFQSQSDKSSL